MNAASQPPPATAPAAVLASWIRARLHPLSPESLDRIPVQTESRASPGGVYRPAAVLLPLVERAEGVSVILTRRADTLARHSGQVALPGGRIEPGETPWAAAIREAHEEIGLEPRFVRPLGLGDRLRTYTGFEITPVAALVAPGFSLVAAEAEVAEVFETPFAFLMDPANHEERVWEGPEGERGRYYAMVHGERMIWGVTAAILRSLWLSLFAGEQTSAAQPT